AAIAIAQQQKARSFELRSALALAKLYQSSGRAPDARAVLTPALEGFAPTPEFPEIAEAQALIATLPLGVHLTEAATFGLGTTPTSRDVGIRPLLKLWETCR